MAVESEDAHCIVGADKTGRYKWLPGRVRFHNVSSGHRFFTGSQSTVQQHTEKSRRRKAALIWQHSTFILPPLFFKILPGMWPYFTSSPCVYMGKAFQGPSCIKEILSFLPEKPECFLTLNMLHTCLRHQVILPHTWLSCLSYLHHLWLRCLSFLLAHSSNKLSCLGPDQRPETYFVHECCHFTKLQSNTKLPLSGTCWVYLCSLESKNIILTRFEATKNDRYQWAIFTCFKIHQNENITLGYNLFFLIIKSYPT